jgi:hypothetical protein
MPNSRLVTMTTVTSKVRGGPALAGLSISPEGKPRVSSRIRLPDLTVRAEIAAKSLLKARTAILEAGTDNIALVPQGRLIVGISAQSKAHPECP